MSHPATVVWVDRDDRINDHVYFRYEITCERPPEVAELHCFADTHYLLRVNGEVVDYGPCRGYPEHPWYDSYDLAELLRPGPNVIAVHAFHTGYETFHHCRNAAGFAAWGELRMRDGSVRSLATPGDWRCLRATGYDREAPRWSFTSPSVVILDEREAVRDWHGPQPSGAWRASVAVDQSAWGEFRPRDIPPLTQRDYPPARLLGAYDHVDDEIIHSFRVGNFSRDDRHQQRKHCAFVGTWIHSPRRQRVRCGRFWGEFYLNGRLLEAESVPRNWRTESDLDLEAGWNCFFGHYGFVHYTWDFHLGLPAAAGLRLSAHRRDDDPDAFLVTPPIERDAAAIQAYRPDAIDPDAIRDRLPEDLPWEGRGQNDVPVFPCIAPSWAGFGPDLGLPVDHFGEWEVPAGTDRSFVIDMGSTVLGRIEIAFDAPPGTVFDLGYAEELFDDRPHMSKSVVMLAGDRHVAAGGPSCFDTFFPRGFRFLQLSVHHHAGPVRIRRLGVVEQRYDYPMTGSFRCSDAVLTRLWAMGRRTLEVCSEDTYTDTPWRERTLYAYDLLPEAATALACSGDTRLIRHCLEILLQSSLAAGRAPASRLRGGCAPSTSDNGLVPFVVLDWYRRWSGDQAFARRAWPLVHAAFERIAGELGEDDLLAMAKPFVDHHGPVKDGVVCAMQALAAYACSLAADYARSLGEDATGDRWQALGERLRTGIAHFWSDGDGAFADAIVDGAATAEHFPTSSYWAACFGCTEPEQDRRIAEFFRAVDAASDDVEREPFGSAYCCFYLLGGCYRTGDAAFAERIMQRHYGHMCEGDDATVWEHFTPTKSRSHAWSSAPTFYASTRILGVRLGFPEPLVDDGILIAPEAETVDWAEGTVPHPRGEVRVEWRVDGGRLHLAYEAPEGVTVRIEPRGRLGELELVCRSGTIAS